MPIPKSHLFAKEIEPSDNPSALHRNIDNLDLLPEDAIVEVLHTLNPSQLHQASRLSKKLQRLANDDVLWKKFMCQLGFEAYNRQGGGQLVKTFLHKYPEFTKPNYKHFIYSNKNRLRKLKP